jgi:competence protein ComEC
MKKELGQAPLFKILLPFLAGVILCALFPDSGLWTIAIEILFLSGLLFIAYRKYLAASKYNLRFLGGAGLSLILIALGMTDVYLHKSNLKPDFFAQKLQPNEWLLVRLAEPLQEKAKSFKAIALVQSTGIPAAAKSAQGRIILYFEKDSTRAFPEYGDLILIKNKVEPLGGPKNPGEFDYSHYMAWQDVYHSAYLKPEEWASTGKNEGTGFWKSVYNIRKKVSSEIAAALHNNEQRGIAEALVLGDESEIPGETLSDYAGTGTLHILSVSGLHVAMILMGLNAIFIFLLRFKYGKLIRLFIILILIWAYAFLTGFSAPIARSVIMFSIVFIGTHAGRQANIYNSICGSALILLLMDPLLLMQAGFQLSFIALTGIVWLQPKIAGWWAPGNKAAKWAWELVSASLAAQLITLPISILYFNQLPVYFLPANLVIIPASFFVLGTGILFVFARLLPFAWLHTALGKLLFGSIWVINKIAAWINHLPGAKWEGLYLNSAMAILLYMCIISGVFAIIYKNKLLIAVTAGSLFAFLIMRNTDVYRQYRQPELHVLSLSQKDPVITIKDGNRLYVLADSSFINDNQQLKYHIKGYAWQNYIAPDHIIAVNLSKKEEWAADHILYRPPFIQFYNKKIMIVDAKIRLENFQTLSPAKDPVEAVLLLDNPQISLAGFYKKCPFKSVIAGSGNFTKKTMEWETECYENNIPFTHLGASVSYSLHI